MDSVGEGEGGKIWENGIETCIYESVLMNCMNLEPIIQSEVIHKEKDSYHILMHIYGI